MINFRLNKAKKNPRREVRREDQITTQVKKLLTEADQKLILMVRS